jgi:signal recognition particle receptor subunit beta
MRKKVEALHSEHLVMVCFVDNSETNSVKHESMHALDSRSQIFCAKQNVRTGRALPLDQQLAF